jgi:hypothetical protein
MLAKQEILGPDEGGLLPKDFPLYLPDFERRLSKAVKQPPLAGILYRKVGWNPAFSGIVERADQVSRDKHICSHGLENHLLQVTQNAFALSEAFGNSTEREKTVLRDENLAFLALTHDLGYADPDLQWAEKTAPAHAEASMRYIDKMRRRPVEIFPITDPEMHQSREILERNFKLYEQIIINSSTDPENMVDQARRVVQNPTPEGRLQLLVAFADKIDFFRSGRLQDIPRPTTPESNPYYFLADAVENYSLDVTDKTINYSVDFKNGWNLTRWQKELRDHGFGWTLELGERLASVSGRSFEMNEAPVTV